MAGRWFEESWMTSTTTRVFHVSSPDRDAVCGQRWGRESFLGVIGVSTVLCKRCRMLRDRDDTG